MKRLTITPFFLIFAVLNPIFLNNAEAEEKPAQPAPAASAKLAEALKITFVFGPLDIEQDKKISEEKKGGITYRLTPQDARARLLAKKTVEDSDINTDYWGGINDAVIAQPEAYIDKLRTLLKNSPEDYKIYAKIAQVHLIGTHDQDRAKRAIRRAVFLKGDSAYLYNMEGVILSSKKNYDEALEGFLTAIKVNKDYYASYFNVGMALFIKKDYIRAKAFFDEAAKNNVNVEDAKMKSALCDMVIKNKIVQFVEAKKKQDQLKEEIASSQKPREDKFARYAGMIKENKHEECIRQLRSSIDKGEDVIDSRLYLAKIYSELGLHKQAIDEYEAVLKLAPENSDVYVLLGEEYFVMKEYTRSAESYKKALLLDPGNFNVFLFLAKDYVQTKDASLAMKAAKEAINLNSESGEAWSMLSDACLLKEDYKASLDALDNALKAKPTDSNIYLKMALVNMKNRDAVKAKECIEKAVLFNPGDKAILEEAASMKKLLSEVKEEKK